MLQKISVTISQRLIRRGVISPDCKRTYEYGFELLLSSIVGVLLIALISLLSQRIFFWIPYMLGFVPLRLYGGGYHAKTHTGCILSFSIAFSLFLLLSNYCASFLYFPEAATIISIFVMIAFAPVETLNKPLSEVRRIKNRRISIALCIANIIVLIFARVFSAGSDSIAFMYFAGTFAASMSALLAVRINHSKRRSESDEAKG